MICVYIYNIYHRDAIQTSYRKPTKAGAKGARKNQATSVPIHISIASPNISVELWCFCPDFSVQHKIFLTAYDLMAKILHQFICGSLDIRGFDAYKIIQDFSHQLYLYYHIIKSLHPSLLLLCPHACVLATWFRLRCVQLHLSFTVGSFLILACSVRW